MAKELLALDRAPVFYFNGTVASGADLPATRGGAAGAYNVNRAAGNVRLLGSIFSAQTPAAGFPRIRFWAGPGDITTNTQVDLYTPTVDAFGAFPIDTPLLTPYFSIEFTQGGTGGNVAGTVWVVPEGGGGGSSGGSSPTSPVYTKDAPLTPLGFGQVTNLDGTTAQTLAQIAGGSIPAGALYAFLQVGTGLAGDTSVVCTSRDDGVAPTAAVGQTRLVGVQYPIEITPLSAFQIIGTSAGPSVVRASFYK